MKIFTISLLANMAISAYCLAVLIPAYSNYEGWILTAFFIAQAFIIFGICYIQNEATKRFFNRFAKTKEEKWSCNFAYYLVSYNMRHRHLNVESFFIYMYNIWKNNPKEVLELMTKYCKDDNDVGDSYRQSFHGFVCYTLCKIDSHKLEEIKESLIKIHPIFSQDIDMVKLTKRGKLYLFTKREFSKLIK